MRSETMSTIDVIKVERTRLELNMRHHDAAIKRRVCQKQVVREVKGNQRVTTTMRELAVMSNGSPQEIAHLAERNSPWVAPRVVLQHVEWDVGTNNPAIWSVDMYDGTGS